jgi:hypothetical protein
LAERIDRHIGQGIGWQRLGGSLALPSRALLVIARCVFEHPLLKFLLAFIAGLEAAVWPTAGRD